MERLEEEARANQGLRGILNHAAPWKRDSSEELGTSRMHDHPFHEFTLTRKTFERVIAHERVQQLFDELEIDELDRKGLFDVLDSDGNNCVTIEELVSGLMAVR